MISKLMGARFEHNGTVITTCPAGPEGDRVRVIRETTHSRTTSSHDTDQEAIEVFLRHAREVLSGSVKP